MPLALGNTPLLADQHWQEDVALKGLEADGLLQPSQLRYIVRVVVRHPDVGPIEGYGKGISSHREAIARLNGLIPPQQGNLHRTMAQPRDVCTDLTIAHNFHHTKAWNVQ